MVSKIVTCIAKKSLTFVREVLFDEFSSFVHLKHYFQDESNLNYPKIIQWPDVNES